MSLPESLAFQGWGAARHGSPTSPRSRLGGSGRVEVGGGGAGRVRPAFPRSLPPTHLRVHSEGESAPVDALLRDDHRSDAIRPTSMTARRATFGRP